MSRTLLLGLDGATYTNLKPMMEAGVMPFLARLVAEGAHGDLMSTPCPVTPPAWTSIVTGRSPGQHGIYDFIQVEDDSTAQVLFRLANGRDVKSETVWSIAGRQGKPASALNFPCTFQLPPFKGWNVPGFVTSRILKMGVHPREFWDRIKTLEGFSLKDVSWDLDEGRKPLSSGVEINEFEGWIDYLIRKETGWAAIAKELIDNTDCQLMTIVFEGVDRLQHQAWTLQEAALMPEKPTEEDKRAKALCDRYFKALDGMLEDLVQRAGPDARTIIVSDHGFGLTTEVFYANAWLAREGYLKWKAADTDKDGLLTAHNMRDHFQSIDWEHTVAYARTTSANGIYIRVGAQAGRSWHPAREI